MNLKLVGRLATSGRWSVCVLATAVAASSMAEADQGPKIINGTPSAENPAVGALLNAAQEQWCTGTLIAPGCVLTAAHCVEEDALAGGSFFIGPDIAAPPQELIGIQSTVVHPQWNPMTLAKDFAIVRLEAPSQVAPIAMSSPPSAGTSVRIIGYGQTEGATSGQKRIASVDVDLVNSTEIWTDGTAANTCFGDSGGPLLKAVGPDWEAVGVTSYGDQNCAVLGVSGRIDSVESWIDQNLAEMCTELMFDGFEHGSLEHWSSNAGYPCPVIRTPPTKENAVLFSADPADYIYDGTLDVGVGAGESVLQVLVLESWGAPVSPEVVDLTTNGNDNYATCGTCVLLFVDCVGGVCAKTLFQREGTLNITALTPQVGESFAASIEATLEEVTIDPKTYVSTPVPGGCVLPIHGYGISLPLEAP